MSKSSKGKYPQSSANNIIPEDQISALLLYILLLNLHKTYLQAFLVGRNMEIHMLYLNIDFLYYKYCLSQNQQLKYFYLNQVNNFQVLNLYELRYITYDKFYFNVYIQFHELFI